MRLSPHPSPLSEGEEDNYGYPNKSMIGLPVLKVREMLLASRGLLMEISTARDYSKSPKTKRNAIEQPQHAIQLAMPLQFNIHVGDPPVELRLVMGAAAHAIADPHRQHLAAGDALSWPIVGLSFLEPHGCHDARGYGGRMSYPNKSLTGLPVVKVREMPLASWGLLMGMSRAW